MALCVAASLTTVIALKQVDVKLNISVLPVKGTLHQLERMPRTVPIDTLQVIPFSLQSLCQGAIYKHY